MHFGRWRGEINKRFSVNCWTDEGLKADVTSYFLSFSGTEYVVAGHQDMKSRRLMVNTKSVAKPWKSSLGRKFLHILKKDCGHWRADGRTNLWLNGRMKECVTEPDYCFSFFFFGIWSRIPNTCTRDSFHPHIHNWPPLFQSPGKWLRGPNCLWLNWTDELPDFATSDPALLPHPSCPKCRHQNNECMLWFIRQ